jgi:ribosomal protein S18 acetylase RimI-like enzyme
MPTTRRRGIEGTDTVAFGGSMNRIEESGGASALDTIVLAFSTDPVERWMYPRAADYVRHFPAFVEAFAGPALAEGTAWMLDDFSAVAFWLPPGRQPRGDAIVAALTNSVAAHKHDDLLAVLEQMDAIHPTFPHWYLPWLGVDPARRGEGLGGRLLDLCLHTVDAQRLPAYLETPNPRTIAFYARRGFEVIGEARSGACPPVTCMLRPARARVV